MASFMRKIQLPWTSRRRELGKQEYTLKPNYEHKSVLPYRRAIEIILSITPIVPLIILVSGIGGSLLLTSSIVLAIIAFFMQPIVVSLNEPPGPDFASILYREGLLEEWACYDWRIPFVALLKNGFVMAVFFQKLGFRVRIVITRSSSHIPLSLNPSTKPKVKVLETLRLIRGDEAPPSLSGVCSRIGVFELEVVQPSVRNKMLLTFFRGRGFLADVLNTSDIQCLVEAVKLGLKLLKEPSPRQAKRKTRAPYSLKS